MSRAINLKAPVEDVIAMCERRAVTISAIEKLPDGGTRVVLTNSEGAATIRTAFKSKIIDSPVRRSPAFSSAR